MDLLLAVVAVDTRETLTMTQWLRRSIDSQRNKSTLPLSADSSIALQLIEPPSAPIATFDTSAFAFPDSSFTHVFNGILPAVSSGRLDFSSLSSFLYDPSLGNLVLTVKSFDAAAAAHG
jgi:hypothetical protein